VVAKKAIKPKRAAEVAGNTNVEAIKVAILVGPGVARKNRELRLDLSTGCLDFNCKDWKTASNPFSPLYHLAATCFKGFN
jgi:hypothetical protein